MLKDNKSREPQQLQRTPKILMCPPNYFKVLGPDSDGEYFNDQSKKGWLLYQKDPNGYLEQAHQQWNTLKTILEEKCRVEVILLSPQPDLSDQVFTADASVSIGDGENFMSFISRFTHPTRQPEAQFHEQILKETHQGRQIFHFDVPCEGSGDNLYDSYRDVFWSGHTQHNNQPAAGRSNISSHRELQEKAGIPVFSIEVQRPFFHVDTCLSCLSAGHIMAYAGGMASESLDMVLREGLYEYDLNPDQYLIPVTEQEARLYGCNLINLGNQIIMPDCDERLPKVLQGMGYEVHVVNLDKFIGAGGGPHCLINYLNHPRNLHAKN